MKTKQLQAILETKTVQIPLYLYREKEKFNLDTENFFFLMYLTSAGKKIKFDPTSMKEDLNVDLEYIMTRIEELSEKKLISVDVEKNKQGMMEEYISLENFWNYVVKVMIEDFNQEDLPEQGTIYEQIEREFGRTLSPIEYEIIGAWVSSNISEELIQEALKEAVFNGVSNLRYMDKILYEWGKKGYKNKKDVERSREKWKNEKSPESRPKKEKKEVFDYNWLEEDDDNE